MTTPMTNARKEIGFPGLSPPRTYLGTSFVQFFHTIVEEFYQLFQKLGFASLS